jgi:hypothetical protein
MVITDSDEPLGSECVGYRIPQTFVDEAPEVISSWLSDTAIRHFCSSPMPDYCKWTTLACEHRMISISMPKYDHFQGRSHPQ